MTSIGWSESSRDHRCFDSPHNLALPFPTFDALLLARPSLSFSRSCRASDTSCPASTVRHRNKPDFLIMASLAMAVVNEAVKELPLHKAISGIFGSISMAAWICVILPQMIVNYRAKSADGLSMPFLVVWMIGDATNLIGAYSCKILTILQILPRRSRLRAELTVTLGGLFTHLAPTAVALAMYFCVADFLLISQCLYYNTINARRAAEEAEATEEAPLLGERRMSHRRSVSSEDVGKIAPAGDELIERSSWSSNAFSLIAVYVVGFMGWYLSYKAGAYNEADPVVFNTVESSDLLEKIGMVLGYFSAVCYLCARIPQIIKNYREKSCEGLSILFFMLSLTGNLTYAISIVAYSQDRKYIINTIPWLIGSLGTVVEDGTIFVQFRLYANNRRSDGQA
ncbi:putative vacuolar amino acid transporter YPQ3 [Trichoderma lentiforme]|uniref:Vacuolar amino acid transporter YPQ3 n=1 Tax=Trichoderma lentiforme TaxID=1567552 RepID=A0A9P4XFN1_9HYPO|nr:putative vacuolar amino acid transporter YPQ3 [Trichoderma lentiforme]